MILSTIADFLSYHHASSVTLDDVAVVRDYAVFFWNAYVLREFCVGDHHRVVAVVGEEILGTDVHHHALEVVLERCGLPVWMSIIW